MVNAIKAGAILPDTARLSRPIDGQGYAVSDGVAIIEIDGAMMKGWSKYGGTSSLWTRAAIRDANANPDVKSILLHIDSPGGTAAGTAELGDDVRASAKPVHAHIDDLGASAAYWVASQSDHVSMNRAGFAGSIGVYSTIYDTSGAAEMEGIKVHVLSTGPLKGAGEPGTVVTEEQLANWQKIVDAHFSHFETAVRGGRKMTQAGFKKVSDGNVFDAKDSLASGLIDEVASFDRALVRAKKAQGKKGE
jgi:signal peptide peptidase SppA